MLKMNLSGYIGSVLLTKDQYLSVTASPETVVDDAQMSAQNVHTEILLPCIRDRYSANTLLFDTRNHITLRQYLASAQFVPDTFRLLLMQLMEAVDALAACNLPQTNMLLGTDHLYIDVVNKRIKLVYLPFRTNIGIGETMDQLAATLREIISIAKVADGHMIFGLILSHINAEKFDIVKFYSDLRDYDLITMKRSPHAISRVMLSYLLNMAFTAICVVGVPLWGVLSNEHAVTQFIDLSTVSYIALLFLAGAILSCVCSLLLRETKRRRKKGSAIPKAQKQKRKRKGQDAAPPVPPAASAPPVAAVENSDAEAAWLEDEQNVRSYVDIPEFSIGRDGERSRCVLGEIGVSGLHASILRTEAGWMLRDEASRNGTLLNGTPVQPGVPMLLKDGDVISFAGVQRVFHIK